MKMFFNLPEVDFFTLVSGGGTVHDVSVNCLNICTNKNYNSEKNIEKESGLILWIPNLCKNKSKQMIHALHCNRLC